MKDYSILYLKNFTSFLARCQGNDRFFKKTTLSFPSGKNKTKKSQLKNIYLLIDYFLIQAKQSPVTHSVYYAVKVKVVSNSIRKADMTHSLCNVVLLAGITLLVYTPLINHA